MAKIQKPATNSHSLLVLQNDTVTFEDSLAVSYTVKHTLITQPSNSTPRIHVIAMRVCQLNARATRWGSHWQVVGRREPEFEFPEPPAHPHGRRTPHPCSSVLVLFVESSFVICTVSPEFITCNQLSLFLLTLLVTSNPRHPSDDCYQCHTRVSKFS